MECNVTVLERAFQLAAGGRYLTVSEIKQRLSVEGYFCSQISGRELCKQLMAIISEARNGRRDCKGTAVAARKRVLERRFGEHP